MAKYKVPSQAANGGQTFSDNLVGNQITNGTSQLSNTNFDIDRIIPEKDSKNFKTTAFSEFLTLEDLNEETNSPTTQTAKEKKTSIRFKGSKNDASKSLFGSLRSRISASIGRIITKYPAAMMVDKDSLIGSSIYTADNISFDTNLGRTQLEVEVSKIYNPYDITIVSPSSFIKPETENSIRNFYSSYKKYVLEINGLTYNVLNYSEPNSSNKVVLKVYGNPFSGATTYSENFLIRPNDGIVEEFYLGLDDLEESLLNRESNPKFTSTFKVPRDSSDKSKIGLVNVEYTWPTSKDGWNLQIVGIAYDSYINDLSSVGEEIDNYKSNLVVRFLSSPQLFEFDTDDKRSESIFQLYGQNFDKVKKYIDNIAYMRNVSYDGVNNLPDILLKNLSNTLGLDSVNLFDETTLDEQLYTRADTSYDGHSLGANAVEAEYEFYRRLLINLAHIYKAKGTKASIEFFLRFLGAPEPLIKINEYVYKVTALPKSYDIQTDIYNVLLGVKTNTVATFNPSTYRYTSVTTTGSTKFSRAGYPVDETTGFARASVDINADMFFEKGAGWYKPTLDHRSGTILDTENSILTGRTKTLKSKSKNFSYGEEYFDVFRTLPGLDTGFELENDIDNEKKRIADENSSFTLNRKNISVYLSSAQAFDYDIYKKSRDLSLVTFGKMEPQTGVTFAEYLDKTLSKNIKNSHAIKYKKNYIVLEEIFRDYITNTNFVPYRFADVNYFIEKMSPYWVQILDQLIPATTQWTGGNVIENNIFGRPKYQYRFGCQPKEFVENLYPDFENVIEEDVESLLGDEDNFRNLVNLTGVTYYPVIEIDGVIYSGSTFKVVVSGTTNTTNSAQLFNTFPQTGCTTLNDSTTNLPLICDYKDYLEPDVSKIKTLWKTALSSLIDTVINVSETRYTAGYENYSPYLNATGKTYTTEYKPKITYKFFTDVDGVDKVKYTSIKYGPNDCSVEEYFDYRFDTEYKISKTTSALDVEVSAVCNVYVGDTDVNCKLPDTDVFIKINGAFGLQKGANGWPVNIHVNCDEGVNENANFRDNRNPDVEFITVNGDTNQCTFLIPQVGQNEVIDLLITDGSNYDRKVKIEGLEFKAEHDPEAKSHTQQFKFTSYKDSLSCLIEQQTGVTFCDNYSGYTIVPKVQYRSSFDYGLKSDSYVLKLNNGVNVNTITSNNVLTNTTKKKVTDVTAGDVLLSAVYLPCNNFHNQDFKLGELNNDYSFTFTYTSVTVNDNECLGSVKKDVITGITKNGVVKVIEVLPTTKLRVYTKKEVNDNGGLVAIKDSYFFTERYPEELQIKATQLDPCCFYPKDYYEHGDYLIMADGELLETIAVNLNYCDAGIFHHLNINGEPPSGNTLILFNGNNDIQVLLQHRYVDYRRFNTNQQQFYSDVQNCPTIPSVESLLRTGTTECEYEIFDPCNITYSRPTQITPTPTPTTTPTATPII